MEAGEKFALGIGPLVAGGTGNVNRPWRRKGDQLVLIHREVVDPIVVLREIVAEPVGETGVDAFHGFSEFAAAQRCTAAAGVVGDRHGESFVLGGGPERGFAEARMPHDGDFFGVYFTVGLEVIEAATQPPRPGGDAAPFIGLRFRIESVDAVFESVVIVRIDVAVVNRCEGIATAEDLFQRVVARLVGEAFLDIAAGDGLRVAAI